MSVLTGRSYLMKNPSRTNEVGALILLCWKFWESNPGHCRLGKSPSLGSTLGFLTNIFFFLGGFHLIFWLLWLHDKNRVNIWCEDRRKLESISQNMKVAHKCSIQMQKLQEVYRKQMWQSHVLNHGKGRGVTKTVYQYPTPESFATINWLHDSQNRLYIFICFACMPACMCTVLAFMVPMEAKRGY